MGTITKTNERQARRLLVAATIAKRSTACSPWGAATDAARLRTLAKRLDTYNEAVCNRPMSEREYKAADGWQREVERIAHLHGASVHFGGDPRGPAVRLYWPDMIPAGGDPDTYSDRMLPVEID
jgi:hypothetical protein